MDPLRHPAVSREVGYPSLSAHADSRRRFLKVCALSGAAATLGLQLVGCPGGNGGGGSSGTPPVTSGSSGYQPWQQTEHLAGDEAMPMGEPVAVVLGGGPIPVTFKDGVKADLVVAGILTPLEDIDAAADASKLAAEHADQIRQVAAGRPSSILADAKALDAFEDAVRDALNPTLRGGYLEEVSAAEAEREPEKVEDRADAAEDAASEEEADAAPMDDVAGDVPGDVPAPAAAPRITKPLKARKLWSPCRKAGCVHCKG